MLLKLNERMLPAVLLICSTHIMKELVSNPCVSPGVCIIKKIEL